MRSRGVALLLSLVSIGALVAAPSGPAHADVAWETIGTGDPLLDVDFVSDVRGWLVGPGGVIYATSDGGATWTKQQSGTAVELRAVDFVDSNMGWAVGDLGTVLATTDGGVTWRAQEGVDWMAWESFTDVVFLDRDRGWVVGTGGTVLETSDGGTVWRVSYADRGPRWAAVDFVDERHGWVVGEGTLLRTKDGGFSWERRPYHLEVAMQGLLRDVDFVDPLHGWVVDAGGVRTTTDGGWTWSAPVQLAGGGIRSTGMHAVAFRNSQEGWAVGDEAVASTSDGGRTWQRRLSPAEDLRDVTVLPSGAVVAAGESDVVVTGPGGGWSEQHLTPHDPTSLRGVDFSDATHGWVVGEGGVIRRTTDGGATWAGQRSGTTKPLVAVDFVDRQHGWAVGGLRSLDGEKGVVLATADGGQTWTAQDIGIAEDHWVTSVSFVDPLYGWVAVDRPRTEALVMATEDGGRTWTEVHSTCCEVQDLVFVDRSHGWMISNNLRYTVDGGRTWTPGTHVSSSGGGAGDFVDLSFLDSLHGWAAGSRGVARTVDGGATWSSYGVPTHPLAAVLAVAFKNPSDGWAVDSMGTGFVTGDGGVTWAAVSVRRPDLRSRPLWALAVDGGGRTWAVGDGGEIVRAPTDPGALVRLNVTPDPLRAGQPFTLAATVGGASGDIRPSWVPPSTGTPTGSVRFTVDGTEVAHAPLASGRATATVAPLPPGTHVFGATYSGDASFVPAVAAVVRVDVGRPVASWGWNSNGQLGSGTQSDALSPGLVPGLTGDIRALSAGALHSLALKADGTVWGWGSNAVGQLGDGTRVDRTSPVQASPLYHVYPISLDGVVAVASGWYHNLALRSDGTVWAWGWNATGQLGAPNVGDRDRPLPVPGLSDVVAIAAGPFHSLAVKADGSVWAWGWNGTGALGDGTLVDRPAPVRVVGLGDTVAVAAGGLHSVALRRDGSVWAWGWNGVGQLGDGTVVDRHTPVPVIGLTGVTALAAGLHHTLARRADGTAWSWGWNVTGQLGDGTRVDRRAPTRVASLSGVTSLSAGGYHSAAVTADGSRWAWGWNGLGQVGNGTSADAPTPTATAPGPPAIMVAAGYVHSLAG